MAFNIAGAAVGAHEGLTEALRRDALRREEERADIRLRSDIEGQRQQREINRINAESLSTYRQELSAARQQKQDLLNNTVLQARRVLEDPDSIDTSFVEDDLTAARVKAFEQARAQHIIRTGGEDVPDGLVNQFYQSVFVPKEPTPARPYQPKTEQEFADIDREARIRAKYRPDPSDREPTSVTERTRQLQYPNWDYGKGEPDYPNEVKRWAYRIVQNSKNSREALATFNREVDRLRDAGNPYIDDERVLESILSGVKAKSPSRQEMMSEILEGGGGGLPENFHPPMALPRPGGGASQSFGIQRNPGGGR